MFLDGLEDRFLIHIDTLGFAEVLQGETGARSG